MDSSLQLQLADLWTRTGKAAEAERLLRRAVDEQPSNGAAWLAYVSALHEQKRDKEALNTIDSVPDTVFSTIANDPAFIAIQAGIYSNLGRYPEALRSVRSAEARLELERKPVPAGLRVQEGWILLNGHGNERELYALLSRYGNSSDLTEAQQKDFNSIWSTWSQKRAAAASDRGDIAEAVKILSSASQLFPADTHMTGTLAGTYLQAGDARNAYLIYKNWGLKEASADDFSGAIGSALTVRDKELAQRWLTRGLQKYPRDARLLSLAGKQAAQQGDYDRAKMYLREALAAVPLQNAGDSGANDVNRAQSDSKKWQASAGRPAAWRWECRCSRSRAAGGRDQRGHRAIADAGAGRRLGSARFKLFCNSPERHRHKRVGKKNESAPRSRFSRSPSSAEDLGRGSLSRTGETSRPFE